ncbi:MFS transporter [Streptomyces sp. NPDC058409]|uniref:MFS transporter n=1 Tax=Streptomyces sp. NPDC058409 TaxID=3346484 RepID=UPI0036519C24
MPQSTWAPSAEVGGRWGKLSLLSGTLVVDQTESSLVGGLFPVIRQSLGLSLGALGVLTAAGKIVGVFTGPFWVWAARRWSRKGVLVLATGLWGVWGIAAGFSQNFAQLLIFYTILAAGYAAAQPVVSEIVADLFDSSSRGRAISYLYGAVALAAAVLGPLKGQLADVEEGWRWGLWGIGAFNILLGIAIWLWFRDPGLGAAEPQLADLSHETREAYAKLTWGRAVSLLRIPSFAILLGSRLLSGHLIVGTFGVVFLVDVYGFSTSVASVVLLPIGVGFLLGNVLGGFAGDWAAGRSPRYGLVGVLQAAQVGFAIVAYVGTQFHYQSIGLFCVFFGLMGLMQGVNPGINRPMVMAVAPPELRAMAFAIYVSVVEAIAFAAFGLGAGLLGDAIGLKAVFLWILVVLMLANGAFLTLLYRPYARDAARAQQELDARRQQALA